jgi:hypothetical protein
LTPNATTHTEKMRILVDTHKAEHVYAATFGPFDVTFAALVMIVLSIVMLMLLLGAFLIWIEGKAWQQ